MLEHDVPVDFISGIGHLSGTSRTGYTGTGTIWCRDDCLGRLLQLLIRVARLDSPHLEFVLDFALLRVCELDVESEGAGVGATAASDRYAEVGAAGRRENRGGDGFIARKHTGAACYIEFFSVVDLDGALALDLVRDRRESHGFG